MVREYRWAERFGYVPYNTFLAEEMLASLAAFSMPLNHKLAFQQVYASDPSDIVLQE